MHPKEADATERRPNGGNHDQNEDGSTDDELRTRPDDVQHVSDRLSPWETDRRGCTLRTRQGTMTE
jgi:hypothetical protein